MRKALLFITICTFWLSALTVQASPSASKKKKPNRKYIQNYQKKYLILRAYESTKFNSFGFNDGKTRLEYKPNDRNNIGIGGTYSFLSLNLGFHMPFADMDTDKYGTTRRLDLQTHIYSKKFIVDFFGQFYRGFYLDNPALVRDNAPTYNIKRPDIHSRDLSLSVQYVFNHTQFSYNAPLYQTEVQKKSAGSFIAGGAVYFSRVFADSAIPPRGMVDSLFFQGRPFTGAAHAGVGLNAGYGYTFVIRKRFFVSSILTLGAGIGNSSIEEHHHTYNSWGPQFDLNFKGAAGYNYDTWFAGVNYMGLVTTSNSALPGTSQYVNRGMFRFTVAHRIKLQKRLAIKAELIKNE